MGHKSLVKAGYEAIASEYAKDRETNSEEDVILLDDFISRLPKGSLVLDAGCGVGVPVAVVLSRLFQVVGLDFANAQLRLAHAQVPLADLVMGDMTDLPFREGCFDGVSSYYAIIHVPREEHRHLVREIYRVLKPSGVALMCMGEHDLASDVAEYMGTQMFWSHFDGTTNERILLENGFEVLWAKSVVDFEDPSTSHRFFLVRKR